MQDFQDIKTTAITKSLSRQSDQTKITKRSLGWCFTLHNYTDDQEAAIKAYPSTFLIYGKEVTGSSVKHLQGYIHFACPGKTGYALHKLINSAVWKQSKGSIDSNIAYCSKMGDYYCQGNNASKASLYIHV